MSPVTISQIFPLRFRCWIFVLCVCVCNTHNSLRWYFLYFSLLFTIIHVCMWLQQRRIYESIHKASKTEHLFFFDGLHLCLPISEFLWYGRKNNNNTQKNLRQVLYIGLINKNLCFVIDLFIIWHLLVYWNDKHNALYTRTNEHTLHRCAVIPFIQHNFVKLWTIDNLREWEHI